MAIYVLFIAIQVQAANTAEEIIQIFTHDEHATFLLYESGSFKKPIQQTLLSDKPLIVRELKDGALYGCWGAILQLQKGLQNLDVLTMVKNCPDVMKDFFCFNPPKLNAGTNKLYYASC